MATFTFVFIFGLIALQGSMVFGSVNTRNLPNNLEEVVAKHNLKALIVEMKKDIEKLLKTSEDERLCGPKVHQLVEDVTKTSQAEAELCLSTMGVSLKELDQCLSRVGNKVSLQGRAIVYGLNQCIDNIELLYTKNLPNNVDEVVANHNLKALIVEIKEDIEKLLKNSEDERLCGPKVHQLVEDVTKTSQAEAELCLSTMGVSLKELDQCLSRVENKVSLRGRAIVYGLNQCIDNIELLFTKNLPNNVDEVLANHNLKALIVEMKTDIKKLLKSSEDERLCGPKAQKLVEDITKTSQAEAELCLSTMGVSLKELDQCLSRVENKVSLQGRAIVYGLNQCIDNVELLYTKNLPNNMEEVVANHNLKALIVEMKEDIKKLLKTSEDERLCGPKAHQLVEDVTKTSQAEAELCLSTMGVSLKELDQCLSRVENKVSLQGRAIVYGLNQCIDNVELLYTKNLPNNMEEVVAKHNLKALIVEMKEDIEKLLKTSEDERLCGPKAHQLVEDVTKTSQAEAELCLSTMAASLMDSQDALKELDLCLSRVENKVSLQGRAIVYSLNQCIDNIELLFTKNLPNNVDEVIANHNVKALIVEMKEDIEKLLKTSEDERLCGPKAHQLVEDVTKTSQAEAELCLSTMGVSLKELDQCLSRVENKVSLRGRAIVYSLNQCINNIELLFTKNLPNNVDEIVANHNLKALIVEMKEDIEKLLKTSKDERLCGPKVHQLVEDVTKTSQAEAELCLSTMGVSLKELDQCLSRVENKVSLEGRAIVYSLNQCIDNIELLFTKNLPNNIDEIVANHNLKELIVEMKEDIEKLFKTSEDERLCGPKAHQLVEDVTKTSQAEAELCLSTMGVSLKELDQCLSRVENKVSLRGRAIVYSLNQCIDNIELLFTKNVPNNVDEVVANHNLKALIVEMKTDIKKLLKSSEDERLCGPKAQQLVEDVTKTSQAEAELCLSTMGVSLKELDQCLSRVENKVSLEGRAIVYSLNQCIDNIDLLFTKNLPNNVDEIVANHNLKALIVEMKEDIEKLLKTSEDERLCGPKVHQLVEDVTKTSQAETELCLSTMGVSLKELDQCLSRVENKVSLRGRAIVYSLNQCIDNIELLFTKNLPNSADEVVANHNLTALIVEMKEDIKKLLKTSKDERLCGPKAHELVEDISKTSQAEAELCLSTMGVSLKELDQCLSRVENKVSLRGRAIVYSLNQCIDNIELLFTKNLPNNVDEVVANHNLTALIVEIKEDIKKLLKTSENERLCGPDAYQLVYDITITSQAEAEQCISTMDSQDAQKLDQCLAWVDFEVSFVISGINYHLNQCLDNIELLY